MRCLLALSLTLGATQANAQTAQDSSVNVPLGGSHLFVLADFPGFPQDTSLYFETYPDRGTLTRGDGGDLADNVGLHEQTAFFGTFDFANPPGNHLRFRYAPPADAISIATGYTDFTFIFQSDRSSAIMTINLVSASTQMAASGAPTVTTATGMIRASIAGVTENNGINVDTLSWQWQQADAPANGAPAADAYADIAGVAATAVTASNFAPFPADVDKYVRACVSFKDQFSAPASEGPLCSIGAQVTEDHVPVRLRLRLFLEGPLR